MKGYRQYALFVSIILLLFCFSGFSETGRRISHEDLKDKIHGYWIGQLAGNYMGFPFENLYVDEPIPILIDRYFDFKDANRLNLKMNLDDRRSYTRIMADAMGGAWSDDDTDIEFVTLHALETYGLDLNYEEITQEWIQHVNRFIWSANRKARNLMDQGLIAPDTGKRENNEYWYRITSQLTNEIWGVIYPGMINQAADRSEWGARITTDGWAIHPDIAFGVMYSVAFFEHDIANVVDIGKESLPRNSPFRRGIEDLLRWRGSGDSWRDARKKLHAKYFDSIEGFEIPYPVGGSIINGLSGILALLYGDGDFVKTVGIATSAGYDCDNQAATCGGLIGVLLGARNIPDFLTLELPSRGKWKEPFNNQYINYSRDSLPNFNKISDIVDRLLALSEQAILESGGRKIIADREVFYEIIVDFE